MTIYTLVVIQRKDGALPYISLHETFEGAKRAQLQYCELYDPRYCYIEMNNTLQP